MTTVATKYSPITAEELKREGISSEHAAAFLRVARNQGDNGSVRYRSVILTRTPGEACLQLLAEGYDAKGFHVKGKSCTWGPMAGFICAEPLFNKKGVAGALGNLGSHVKSLTVDFEATLHAAQVEAAKKKGAPLAAPAPVTSRLIPIEISDARRLALIAGRTITPARATDTEIEGTSVVGEIKVPWRLVRARREDPRWRVLYRPASLPALALTPKDEATAATLRAKIDALKIPGEWQPVLALTNPYPCYADLGDHRHAITGDFDLFAVWPEDTPQTAALFDTRVAGMQADPRANKGIYAAEEGSLIGSVTGNISSGVYEVAVALNLAMGSPAAPNRVFHSDEGGRPGMDEIDASVAFHPDGSVHLLPANSPAFAAFVRRCAGEGYRIYLNAGWVGPLRALLGADAAAILAKVRWQQGEAQLTR